MELKAGEFITRAGSREFHLDEAACASPASLPLPEMPLQGQCHSPRLAHASHCVGSSLLTWGQFLALLPAGAAARGHPGSNGEARRVLLSVLLLTPQILDDQGAEGGLLGPRSQVLGLFWYFLKV